ncbi:MAG: hypothetical protein MUO26_01820 [Methanotrichaceae archaeon]|nr:hypothetical protein [Methanotrichaceae archaeon]
MKRWLALVFLLLSPSYAVASQDENFRYPEEGGTINISLNGNDTIDLPNISFYSSESAWALKNKEYPIFLDKQKLNGIIAGPSNLSGSEIKLCIVSFDINSFLNEFELPRAVRCRWTTRMNSSAIANFKIQKIEGGFYTFLVLDEKNSTILLIEPLMVNYLDMIIDTPNEINVGSPTSVTIRTTLKPVGRKRLYVAILVPERDFKESNLIASKNSSTNDIFLTIKIGNKSMNVEGLPVITPDFVMSLTSVLPTNNAIAAMESDQEMAELYLLTDPSWEKGYYILTCAIFDIEKGLLYRDQEMKLLGFKQKTIKLI